MPCPPGLCAFQADCPDTHCPGNPRGSGEHSSYWARDVADSHTRAMHAPLQPEPLPIMFLDEPTEADERKDVPPYTLASIVRASLKLGGVVAAVCFFAYVLAMAH